ncbi:hypothetical protein MMC11_005817 [Xylographa trunciseda]|nr:hypothetical protein [Xylographa trunciseda]
MADIFVAMMWTAHGVFAGQGYRESARLYRSDMGILLDENILLKGTPAVGLILFVLIPVPQALKLFGSSGIPGTQAWGAIFLLAYLVSIFINTLGVSHNDKATKSKPRAILDRRARQALVIRSDLVYAVAYLAQLGVWIWIAVELFQYGFVSGIENPLSTEISPMSIAYLLGQSIPVGVFVFICWIIFVTRVPNATYVAWATGLWLNAPAIVGVIPFIAVIICILVAVAFVAAGVAITMIMDVSFKKVGRVIAGPPTVKQVQIPIVHTAAILIRETPTATIPHNNDRDDTQDAANSGGVHLGSTSDSNSSERRCKGSLPSLYCSPAVLEGVHIRHTTTSNSTTDLDEALAIAPRIRRSQSHHFLPGHVRRSSLALETGLLSNIKSLKLENQHQSTGTVSPKVYKPAVEQESFQRLLWNPSEHKSLRRKLSIGFAITNLALVTLFYGYKYKSEGTFRFSWTEKVA